MHHFRGHGGFLHRGQYFSKKKFRKFQFSTAILKIQKQTIYRWKALRFLYKKFVHECFVQVTVLFGNDWEEWKCEKMHSRLYLKWSAFFALHSKLAKIIIELHLNLFSIKFKKYRVGNWNWLVGIKFARYAAVANWLLLTTITLISNWVPYKNKERGDNFKYTL